MQRSIKNEILHIDCMEAMREIPDGFFDLLIADPPYGHNINYYKRPQDRYKGQAARKRDYPDDISWNQLLGPEYFAEFFRVSKNQLIFGANYFSDILPVSPGWVVWDKENTGNWADCELIWTSYPGAVRKIRWRWNGMIQERMGPEKEERYHPTQKPVGLIKQLIFKTVKPDRDDFWIFDPCAGAGSVLIAAKEEGYTWTGCEIEKAYYDIACQRLARTYHTPKLWAPMFEPETSRNEGKDPPCPEKK